MIHEGREGIESRDKELILQCKEPRVKTIYGSVIVPEVMH